MFQGSAFQGGAFQIGHAQDIPAQTGGHYLPIYGTHKYKKQPLGNIIHIYQEIREKASDDAYLIEAIEPFVEIESSELLPPASSIDFAAMYENDGAMERFLLALQGIEAQLSLAIQQQEDDDLFLIASIV